MVFPINFGGGHTKTNTSGSASSQPWVMQQPFLSDIYGQARDVYNQGGTPYYPGQQVAKFNPYQQQVFGDISANRYGSDMERQLGAHMIHYARQPLQKGSFANNSMRNLSAAAQGQYLPGGRYANPYLDATFDQAANRITQQFSEVTRPNSNLAFSRAGRSGSGAQGMADQRQFENFVRNQSDLATRLYGGAYEAERQRQQQAAQFGASQGNQNALWALKQCRAALAALERPDQPFAERGRSGPAAESEPHRR